MIALLLALQVSSATPQRFSIMVDPCASASDDKGKDVVVCGHPDTITPRMPLRDDRGPPDHPVPVNPDATGIGALGAESTPCAAHIGGCTVGFGQPIVAKAIELAGYGLKGLKDSRARRRDGDRRVAIDLSDTPAPIPAGAVRP